MAQEFLVTGNKFNKNVRIVLGILLLAIVSGLVLISGWRPNIFPSVNKPATVQIAELTTSVVQGSKFGMPYLINVVRADGAYTFANIESGVLNGDSLIGLTGLTYQNGDSGLVKEANGKIDIFVSKTGKVESTDIIERAVTGITLPDGSVYPVKVINGKISRGVMIGDFEMASLIDNKRILGNFDTRGNLVHAEVSPSINDPDKASALVGRELIKLYLNIASENSGKVLAATTDKPIDSATSTIVGEALNTSFFQVKQNLPDGSLTLAQAPGLPNTGAVGTAFGPQGPQGDKGDKGDKGDQGIAGALGPAGAAGPAGSSSSTGVSALNLLTGALSIAGGGINSVTTNGTDTITVTGTLPSVGTAGTYGSSTQVPVFTTDAQGRITGVTNTTITGIPASAVPFSGITSSTNTSAAMVVGSGASLNFSGTGTINASSINGATLGTTTATSGNLLIGNGTSWVTQSLSGDATINSTGVLSLKNVGTANTYGSALNIPVITTDAQGRITAVTNTAISGLTTSNLSATAGITNGQLANSSITVTPTAGTGISVSGSPVSLGGTLTVAGIDATTAVKGVASFNSTNFSVSSGAVNTIQNINTGASPTFTGLNLSGLTASSGVYTDGSKQLTSTAPTSGILGFWNRTGTTLSPATAGDAVTTTGSISTTGTGTITSAGLLTASNGFTQTTGATNITGTSGALALSGLSASSINSGANNLTFTSGNFNTTATGINSTAIGTTTASTGRFTSVTDTGLAINSAVYTDGSSVLTTTAPTTGTLGFWNRTGTTLSPATAGDAVTTSGTISTSGTGTITSAGTLTASNGFTQTTGATNIIGTSGALALSGLSASSIDSGANNLTFTSGNFNTTATGINSTAIGTSTASTGKFTTLTSTGATDLANAGASNVTIATTGTGNTTIGNSTGTFALTSNGGLNVTTGGALTGVTSLDTITTSATALTFAGTGTLDTTAAALNLGTSGATSVSIGKSGITTTNNGALTSTQTLTASNGLTQTTGALNLTATSGTLSLSGLSASSINSGANNLTFTSGNFNTTATGINSTAIGATTASTGRFTSVTDTGLAINSGVYTDGSSVLTTTAPTSGNLGFWNRTGTTLSPVTAGDAVTTSGNISTTGTGIVILAGGQTADLTTPAATALTIDSGTTGTISIGNSANAKTINLGTGAAVVETINVGGTGANVIALANTQTAGSLTAGNAMTTGTISIGGTAQTGTITLGSSSGTNTLNIANGTGATTLNLANAQTAGSFNVGTGMTTGTISIGGTAETGTMTLGSSSGTNTLNIANGAGATTLNLANAQNAGAVSIGAGMTTGTISIGGTGAQTGTISLGTGTGAQTISLGTGTGAKTITLGSQTGASALTLDSGTGAINLGTTIAKTITIGNTTGGTGIVANAGTAGINMDSNSLFVDTVNHRVGIGFTTPSFISSTQGTVASGNIAAITNLNAANSSAQSVLRLNSGTTTGGGQNQARFIQFFAGSTTDANGTGVGNIHQNNAGVTYATGNADLAEYMTVPSGQGATAGDIIAANSGGNVKASSSNVFLIGVVSDTAGFIGNANALSESDANTQPVGIAGFVNTKVTGTIAIGDPITVGSTAGVGVKATTAGYIIGKAAAAHSGATTDRILVSVMPGWFDPVPYIPATTVAYTTSGNGTVLDSNGNPVTLIGGYQGLSVRDATISSTLKLGSNLFTNLAGNGLTDSANVLTVNLTGSGTSANTSSNSGLEVTSSGLAMLRGCANNQVLAWNSGTSNWQCTNVTASSAAFSSLTSGTNTAAAMLVGTGASLNFTGTGTINASSLGGATFASPGAIGGTASASGTFTSLSGSSIADTGLTTNGVVTNTSGGVLGTLAGTTTTILHGNASGLPTFTSVTGNDLAANITISTTGNISTTGSGTITSAGLLTGSNGLTISSGTISLPSASIANTVLANSSLTVTAGTGLSGGGSVSLGGTTTLSLPNVGTANTYGSALNIPVLTTDVQGRVTAVTNTAISGLTATNLTAGDFSSKINVGTYSINISGNAATASSAFNATMLQNARNINGVSFNGTADITVTAAAGTLTGTTLNSGVTASSLTSVGTLSGLTVTGTTNINTSGTSNTAMGNSTGTFALTSSGGLNVTTGGALTGVASVDTIAHSATAITFAGAGTVDVTSAALNLGTSGATSVSLGKSGITTTNSGALTSTQTLTASSGFTLTTGALTFAPTSGTINATGLTALTETLSSGTAAVTAPTLNLNTSSTGATAIGNSTGTFALTSSGGLNVTTGGALTGVASLDTITTSATALTFAGAGTISSTTTSGITLDSGTTGAVNIGNGGNGKTITMGNNSGATAINLTTGTGSLTHTSSVATGTGASSAFVFNASSLTSGTALRLTSTTTSGLLFDQNATNTSGTIDNLAYGAATTLSGAVTGLNIDLSTNVTSTTQALTGINLLLAADTNIDTHSDTGLSMTLGATTQNTAASTGNAIGVDISMGALTLTSGTALNGYGLRVTTGNVTQTAGSLTENGILVDSSNDTFTTGGIINGVKISGPTTLSAIGTYNSIFLGTSASSSANTVDQATIAVGNIASTATNNFSTLNIQNGGTGFLDLELVHGMLNMQGMNTFSDDFTGRALDTTNKWQAIVSSGAGNTCSSTFITGTVNGVLQFTTSGTSGRGCDLTTQATLTNGFYQRGNNPVFETAVSLSNITNARVYAGFTDTKVAFGGNTNASTNHAYIGLRSTDTQWQCITDDGTATESFVSTGVTAVANTKYRLRVEVRNGTTPETICTVDNGTTVARVANTAHQPGATSPMDIYIKAEAGGGGSVVANWDYVRTWQDDPIGQALVISNPSIQSPEATATAVLSSSISVASVSDAPTIDIVPAQETTPSAAWMADITNALTAFINNIVDFFGKVIFHNDVAFLGRPTFNKDTAGFAIVKSGDNEVQVTFYKEYASEPVVTTSLQIAGAVDMNSLPTYAVADVDTKGFKIKLSRGTSMDIRFSWMAIAVNSVTNSVSNGGGTITPIPTVTLVPSVTPIATPTPSDTLTPSPVSTDSASPTPTTIPTPTILISPTVSLTQTASGSGTL